MHQAQKGPWGPVPQLCSLSVPQLEVSRACGGGRRVGQSDSEVRSARSPWGGGCEGGVCPGHGALFCPLLLAAVEHAWTCPRWVQSAWGMHIPTSYMGKWPVLSREWAAAVVPGLPIAYEETLLSSPRQQRSALGHRVWPGPVCSGWERSPDSLARPVSGALYCCSASSCPARVDTPVLPLLAAQAAEPAVWPAHLVGQWGRCQFPGVLSAPAPPPPALLVGPLQQLLWARGQ